MHANINIAKGSKAVRKDPACGTCRKKCRKCDRTRPVCNRCKVKGLHCEGYPPRFQFCESAPLSTAASKGQDEERSEAILPTREPDRSEEHSSPSDQTSISAGQQSGHGLDHRLQLNTSSAAPESPQNLSVGYPSPVPIDGYHVDDTLLTPQSRKLLVYFDKELSQHLAIVVDQKENPFHVHVLPLAYKHSGILHAVLGLAACHLNLSPYRADHVDMTTALQHRVAALNVLSSLLIKEEVYGLVPAEEESVLGIILLLVLHDICEMGISSHAVHLTGVSFLCGRVAAASDSSRRTSASMFFLSALAWLDVLRGFSGAEKLTYSEDVRLCIVADKNAQLSLHTFVECPPVIFRRISEVIVAAKHQRAGLLSLPDFEQVLGDAEVFFREIDLDKLDYPTAHAEWKDLADAYRHACLLRVLRWPDTFSIPCEDERVKASVSAILNACSRVPMNSPFYKRLLFPLFVAAVDTSIDHQIHYATLCIQEIKRSTGFRHAAMAEILDKVWEARRNNTRGWPNVPWMEFTCSEALKQQHAYLFF
ncbi:uncharacterized protein CTRU02_208014 [Colletotrichum truncatum]|uniref:Uncharacterized protein n=1 Tax=Colletotrichum truncatum TaxID=5467 RepID=A0ACC3YV26_COLTU|nr:uncharacterized protein CTRU02_10987 [Colletotrichum truncatum]KAF6786489.1 hypothetical protein CTRU02_10987 [Colletotrichum truncatum]